MRLRGLKILFFNMHWNQIVKGLKQYCMSPFRFYFSFDSSYLNLFNTSRSFNSFPKPLLHGLNNFQTDRFSLFETIFN